MSTFTFGWALDFGQMFAFLRVFFYAYKLPFRFRFLPHVFVGPIPRQLLGRDLQEYRFDLKPGV